MQAFALICLHIRTRTSRVSSTAYQVSDLSSPASSPISGNATMDLVSDIEPNSYRDLHPHEGTQDTCSAVTLAVSRDGPTPKSPLSLQSIDLACAGDVPEDVTVGEDSRVQEQQSTQGGENLDHDSDGVGDTTRDRGAVMVGDLVTRNSDVGRRDVEAGERSATGICRGAEVEDKVLVTDGCANEKNDEQRSNTQTDTQESQEPSSDQNSGQSTVLRVMGELRARGQDFVRVKLYIADEYTGNWESEGIGVVDLRGDDNGFYLTLTTGPEFGHPTPIALLDCKVDENTNYAIQNDAVITWTTSSQLQKGLSFVEKEGCRGLWSCLELLVPDRTVATTEGEDQDDTNEGDETEIVDREGAPEDLLSRYRGEEGVTRGAPVLATVKRQRSVMRETAMQQTRIPPPNSGHAVFTILQYLRRLNDPKDPSVVPRLAPSILREMTQNFWLKSLWDMVDDRIHHEDEECCAVVADLLCHMIAMYTVSSNPFTHLALSPSAEKCVDPDDPLVKLLSDEHYTNFFRAMEYESELRKHGLRIGHVEFLKNVSEFKDVICTENEIFSWACHFIYRILYLRDVCLPRHLDEPTIQRLTGIINTGYAYVCRLILLTPNSLLQLRNMIPCDVDAARFLLQLLTVLRSNIVATPEKNQIYNSLKNDCVLESLTEYLTGDCPAAREWPVLRKEMMRKQREAELRMSEAIRNDPERKHRPQLLSHERVSVPTLEEIAIEIFSLSIEHSPALLRHALLSRVDEYGSPVLWFALCEIFRTSDNPGLHIQLSEIFRKVSDPITLDDPERDDLLLKFYDYRVVDRLIDLVVVPPPQTYEDLFPHFPNLASPYFIPDDWSDCGSDDDHEMCFLFETPSSTTSASQQQDSPSSQNVKPTGTPPHQMSDTNQNMCDVESISPPSWSTPIRFPRQQPEQPHENDDERPPKRRASTDSFNSNHPVPVDVSPSDHHYYDDTVVVSNNPNHARSPPSNPVVSPFNDPSATFSSEAPGRVSPGVSLRRETRLHRRIRKGLLSPEEKQRLLFQSRTQLSFAKCQISEILSFCVLKHNSRIKYRNFQRHLHVRLIEVACDPIYDQFVALYAVKFLKACIVTDEHYSRLFIRHDVFRPLFYILCHCVPKARCRGDGSVVESAILELLSIICRASQQSQGMAQLLRHIIEHYSDQVNELIDYYSAISHFDLFQQLQQQYNALVQPSDRRWSTSSIGSSSQGGRRSVESAGLTSVRDTVDGTDHDGMHEEPVGQYWATQTRPVDEEQRRRLSEEQYFDIDEETSRDGPTIPSSQAAAPMKALSSETAQTNDESLLLPLTSRFSAEDDDDEEIPDFLRASSHSSAASHSDSEPGRPGKASLEFILSKDVHRASQPSTELNQLNHQQVHQQT